LMSTATSPRPIAGSSVGLVPLAMLFTLSCGGERSADVIDADDGAAATGGAAVAGTGGAGGTAGSGSGGGGGAPTGCPPAAPTAGAPCTGSSSCFYEDCAGSGRVSAACSQGTWAVQTAACAPVTCRGEPCDAGQICWITMGGTINARCVPNRCETGPVSCGCLSCPSMCTLDATLANGVEINCNICGD